MTEEQLKGLRRSMWGYDGMEEDSQGEWVLWDEAKAAIQNQVAEIELSAWHSQFGSQLSHAVADRDHLREENQRLRAYKADREALEPKRG